MSHKINSPVSEMGDTHMNVSSNPHTSQSSENVQGTSSNLHADQLLALRSKVTDKTEEACIEMVHALSLDEEPEEVRFRMASRILLWAARKKFDSLVLLICEKIPQVKNATDTYGNTALHISAYLCHTDCIKILLMCGCNKEAKNNKGYTPLHMAVKGGQMASVCWLCDSGVDLNSTDGEQNTPLMLAIMWSYPKLAQVILRYGCDANKQGPNGRTALHLAVLYENMEILQMLIEASANVEVMDHHGRRALHYAGYVGSTTSAGILLQAGADHKATDHAGKTPANMTSNYIVLQLLSKE